MDGDQVLACTGGLDWMLIAAGSSSLRIEPCLSVTPASLMAIALSRRLATRLGVGDCCCGCRSTTGVATSARLQLSSSSTSRQGFRDAAVSSRGVILPLLGDINGGRGYLPRTGEAIVGVTGETGRRVNHLWPGISCVREKSNLSTNRVQNYDA